MNKQKLLIIIMMCVGQFSLHGMFGDYVSGPHELGIPGLRPEDVKGIKQVDRQALMTRYKDSEPKDQAYWRGQAHRLQPAHLWPKDSPLRLREQGRNGSLSSMEDNKLQPAMSSQLSWFDRFNIFNKHTLGERWFGKRVADHQRLSWSDRLSPGANHTLTERVTGIKLTAKRT